MTPVTIKEVQNSKDLDAFINFNYDLYKGSEYAVPELYSDLKSCFTPSENAALDFCDYKIMLAYRDGKVVGRVVAIINNRANETWKTRNVRFGWIDFIDDIEVSRALIDAVAEFGRQHGMDQINGPLGFTDFDREGMLIRGFNELGTMSTYYNYPYYPEHMERLGFEKEIDWAERRMPVPDSIPDKYSRIAAMVGKRYNLQIKEIKSVKQLIKDGWGKAIFDLLNQSYAPLFGFSRLDDKQIDQYVHKFLPLIDLRMQALVFNENDELVACGLSMPSIVRALQKSGGKLFPFGWWHLLKSLKWKHEDGVELLLIAVRPDYQSKGINSLIFNHLIPVYQKMGFKWAETNPQLEDNYQSQAQWAYLNPEVPKERRCFKKSL